jgi:hypothetical protein
MTHPTGRSFLSYRRTRLDEARLLIEAQHDIGIPTWQDLSDLAEGHTDVLLREALAVDTTANAVYWLPPDVEESDVITRTELPSILKRIDRNDEWGLVRHGTRYLLVMQSGAEANHFYFARRECSPNRANLASAGSLRCAAD